ncbi:sugar phosphate isomerase/epimerase family protein [Microbacterium tumbae]
MTGLSVQLYSVRDDLGERTPAALARLHALGYRDVEPYDIVSDPALLAGRLADAGLRAPTAHSSFLRREAPEILAAAQVVGVGTVIQPWVEPERFQSREGIASVASVVNGAAALAADRGVAVGYHNHDFEFAAIVDGRPAWEILVDELDAGVVLELDAYWASVGGADVFDLLRRYASRIRFLHVNDEPPEPDDPPTLGVPLVGRMDEVVAAGGEGIELAVVEVVVDGDPFAALARNTAYFQEVLAR